MSTRKFKCLIYIKTHVRLVLKLTITTKTPKYFFFEKFQEIDKIFSLGLNL